MLIDKLKEIKERIKTSYQDHPTEYTEIDIQIAWDLYDLIERTEWESLK